jgi:hypothetical protein
MYGVYDLRGQQDRMNQHERCSHGAWIMLWVFSQVGLSFSRTKHTSMSIDDWAA